MLCFGRAFLYMTANHPPVAAKSAVLLVNLGSPDAPTAAALRPYLAEFLSDPRVIDLPRWQWLFILHAFILRKRPKQSAALYAKVWTDQGAPLIEITRQQTEALRQRLHQGAGRQEVIVDYAMRYGNPSVESKLRALQAQGVNQLLILPMYPQYCDATTATVIDAVGDAFKKMRYMPEWRFVHHWHDEPAYIAALAQTMREYLHNHAMPEKLLFSFHGVPQRYLHEGDPYYCFCQKTARLVAESLGLPASQFMVVFQSQFGKEVWLQPYADQTIERLAKEGVKSLAVMCPGFSADCLETLEEMAEANRELFLQHGGERYDYIPALNARPDHIDLLHDLVLRHTQDWPAFARGA